MGGSMEVEPKGVFSRSVLTMLDQALSSLFSLCAGFAAARTLAAEDFGMFAGIFVTFLLARGFVRAVALDPITIRFADSRSAANAKYGLSIALVTGVLTWIGLAIASVFINSLVFSVAAVSGGAVLLLLIVDYSRALDIAAGRPSLAVRSGVVLLAGTLAMAMVTLWTDLSLALLMSIVGYAALLTIVSRYSRIVKPAAFSDLASWLRGSRHLSRPLVFDFLANLGVVYFAIYFLAAIDIAEAGILRAAQMVGAPIFMMLLGITQVVMTEGARGRQDSNAFVIRIAKIAGSVAVLGALGYLGTVFFFRGLVESALGDIGRQSITASMAMIVLATLTIPSAVASGLLRAVQRPELVLRARGLSAVPVLLSSIVGGLLGGATGVVVWGIGAQVVTLPLWAMAISSGLAGATDDQKPPETKRGTEFKGVAGADPTVGPASTRHNPQGYVTADDREFADMVTVGSSGLERLDATAGNGTGASNGNGAVGQMERAMRRVNEQTVPAPSSAGNGARRPPTARTEMPSLRLSKVVPQQGGPSHVPMETMGILDQRASHRGEGPIPVDGLKRSGVSLTHLIRSFLVFSWLIAAMGLGGAYLADRLARPAEAERAVASVPMALEGVAWPELEATHQWNENWTRTVLPLQTEFGSVEFRYRQPADPQISSFSIEAQAATDAEALAAADDAAERLVAAHLEVAMEGRRASKVAVSERIRLASDRLRIIIDNIAEARVTQEQLIDDDEPATVVAVVTSEIWTLETERNTWERELFGAQAEAARVNIEDQQVAPPVDRLGPPNLERTSEPEQASSQRLPGAIAGAFLGVIAAYYLGSITGRVGDGGHPQVRALDVPITDLSGKEVDVAGFLAVADLVEQRGRVVSILDSPGSGGTGRFALALRTAGVQDSLLKTLIPDDQDIGMVGTDAILIADRERSTARSVVKRYRRCRQLGVPVVRLVIIDQNTVGRLLLHSWVD